MDCSLSFIDPSKEESIEQSDSRDRNLNMPPGPFPVTRLAASASLLQALATHWREYLMEAAELATLMFSICSFGTLIYSPASPLQLWGLSNVAKSFLMGIAVAAATLLIIRSPFGRRTGAHFNPAVTLTYFYLARVHRWDTLYYIAFQFAGGFVGVLLAHALFGHDLSAPPVCYVITTSGNYGNAIAFAAEFFAVGVADGRSSLRSESLASGEIQPARCRGHHCLLLRALSIPFRV
jgi:aquaporin Z